MQVLSFDLLLRCDIDAIQHAQLRNVEKNLDSEVLPVLNRVETHVELGQQFESLHVAQLLNFLDLVEREVEEAETCNELETFQVHNGIVA